MQTFKRFGADGSYGFGFLNLLFADFCHLVGLCEYLKFSESVGDFEQSFVFFLECLRVIVGF